MLFGGIIAFISPFPVIPGCGRECNKGREAASEDPGHSVEVVHTTGVVEVQSVQKRSLKIINTMKNGFLSRTAYFDSMNMS